MAPTIGRIVLVTLCDGAEPPREVPAIVTAVHSPTMINCRVFEDGPGMPWTTSVPQESCDGAPGYGGPTWRWPQPTQQPAQR